MVSAAPQDRQNFLPGVTGVPQLGQALSSRAPQSSQKRAPASFSAWHRGHFMPEPPHGRAADFEGAPRLALCARRDQETAGTPRCGEGLLLELGHGLMV